MNDTNRPRLFIPGPTEIHPDVAAAMLRPMIGHRGAEFRAMYARLQTGLRDVFDTKGPVIIVTSSSTALMEMAVRSAPKGKILALVNGGFSERFADVARACGRDVVQLDVPWGAAHDLAEVDRALTGAAFAAVTVVHCETSTGVLSDIEGVTRIAHAHGAMCLIDAVSSLGGAPCDGDAWKLDFVFAGSQKTLALPPGLALALASEALVESARGNATRGYYLDLVSYIEDAATNETPSTPALSLFYALEAQLERIAAEGMPQRLARHASMAAVVHEWAERMAADNLGTGILAPPGYRSPTVSVITLSEKTPTAKVLHAMRSRGFTIGAGYGPLGGSSIRIGHMGEHTVGSVRACLDALSDSLRALLAGGVS